MSWRGGWSVGSIMSGPKTQLESCSLLVNSFGGREGGGNKTQRSWKGLLPAAAPKLSCSSPHPPSPLGTSCRQGCLSWTANKGPPSGSGCLTSWHQTGSWTPTAQLNPPPSDGSRTEHVLRHSQRADKPQRGFPATGDALFPFGEWEVVEITATLDMQAAFAAVKVHGLMEGRQRFGL